MVKTARNQGAQPARLALAVAAAGVAALLAASPAAMAQSFSAEVQEHLDEAIKNSGGDLDLINKYRTFSCDATEDPGMYDRSSPERHATRVPLTQVFDDVWYIGDMYVGQYILKTPSGGFLLIDTLNRGSEVDQYTIPALESLGLGPAHPLQAVVLTHGHFDHDGGATRLRELFGPDLPIYLGSGDNQPPIGPATGKVYKPILMDSSNAEPQEQTIAGIRFVLQAIPGHTPGMFNFVVPVHQGGKEYKLMMGGRQGHPTGIASARQYLTGTERSYRLVQKYNVDGTFLTHPTSDGSTVNMQAMVRAGTRDNNPFFIGNERTLRAAAIWRGCAAAWLALRDAAANVAVWRVTSLTFTEPKKLTNTLSAQLLTGWGIDDPDKSAGWGALAGQAVTFSVDGAFACTAVTDAQGVATCDAASKLLPNQRVSASYEGSNPTPNVVNLATSKSTVVPPR